MGEGGREEGRKFEGKVQMGRDGQKRDGRKRDRGGQKLTIHTHILNIQHISI